MGGGEELYVCPGVRACVRACVRTCVRTCVCVRACVRARARAHSECVSLTLHCCYKKNDSTPRGVNVVHHFNVSLIVRGKVTDNVHEQQS